MHAAVTGTLDAKNLNQNVVISEMMLFGCVYVRASVCVVHVCVSACAHAVALPGRLGRQHGDLGAGLLNELLQVDLS